ncbi:MAG: phosphohydrolase [Deltaproteobacteria bacterium RBG_16_47_11]|nr:MAG: phosphohydrolase [Deltaproteobacteria bacterium RBG_16_47_11]
MRQHWSQDKYIEAYWFAADAHRNQTVPGTDLPYIIHPTLVSMEVIAALDMELGRDEDLAVQCALLHDVIEDRGVNYEQVKSDFGEAVAKGVLALSKDKKLAKRLQLGDSLSRIKLQPREVWMVKLADRITNLRPPPNFWTGAKIARYREEAHRIYQVLKDASPVLSTRLMAKIDAYKTYMK